MKGTIAVALTMMWGTTTWASDAKAHDARMNEEGAWSFAIHPVVEVEAVAGQKSLDRDEYRRLALQSEAGMRVTISRRPDATFGLVADWMEGRSEKTGDGFAMFAATRELALGVRSRIDGGRIQGVVGAGVAHVRSDLSTSYVVGSKSVREDAVGVWYSFGVRVPLSARVTAGADVRQTIGGAGGFHVGATVGVRLGSLGGHSSSGTRIAAWGQR